MIPPHPLRALASSVRRDGPALTAGKVLSVLRDAGFDLLHGTDTSAHVRVRDTDVSGPNVVHAFDYAPTSHNEARVLFRRIGLADERGAFVDFGCGKGRMLLLASEYSFDRVVGVEFSARMCDVARTNLERYRGPATGHVEVRNEDASDYRFRDDETVLFFFNPFEEAVMRSVLENVYRSLRRCNRRVWVIYNNPRCRDLLESGGVFVKVGEHRLPRIAAAVYTNVGTDPRSIRAEHAGTPRTSERLAPA